MIKCTIFSIATIVVVFFFLRIPEISTWLETLWSTPVQMGITSVETLWLTALKTKGGGQELWFVKVGHHSINFATEVMYLFL